MAATENAWKPVEADTLHPPYLNAELYRASTKWNALPPPYLDVIRIAPDGKALVGRSNLTGRLWNGTVQTVDTTEDITKVVQSHSSFPTMMISNGVADARFMLDTTKIIVGDDCGDLSIWSRQELWSNVTKSEIQYDSWCASCNACEHDDAIIALDLSVSGDKIVTGGADGCIKVWDLSLISTETYRPAHTDIISDVTYHRTDNKIFLSSSLDGTVAVWDSRNNVNKADVLSTMPYPTRCVCWLTEKYLAIGYENGDVIIFDFFDRQPLFTLSLGFPIHKIIYHEVSKHLALCGDSEKVIIFKVTDDMKLEKIYEDSRHKRFARCIAWDNNDPVNLYSCGWDTQIIIHSFLKK